MTTVHLSDAQRDTFAASGLIVIDPEPHVATISGELYWSAPEGWRILTEPCGTCDGHGFVQQPPWVCLNTPLRCPNPDCVGGRRVVTLTATCPMQWLAGYPCDGWILDNDGDRAGKCDRCTDGVVTLGRFTIPALLPVPETLDDATPEDQRIFNAMTTPQILTAGMARPGQFIARPERVA